MRIAVLNNCVPFLRGGAEHLADALTAKLQEYGHEAVLIRVPFRWDPPEKIIEHMLACRLLRLPNVDRAIAIKFPAAYVPHPNKVLWLVHQFRQAYDFWGTGFQGLPDSVHGRQIRDAVTRADNTFLAEAKAIYTNSKVTGDRLRRFNGIESEVLLPPLFEPVVVEQPECGDFILCLGRVNAAKRQYSVVKAVKYCKTEVKLIVAGRPESDADAAAIRTAIRKDDLAQRVTFIDRFVSEKEKADLLRRCLAVAYIPYDEDSYGYVTLEACLSKKAVITCTDSGGIDALVRHRETGYIVPPEPKALADAMDSLYSDKSRAAAMGRLGFDLARSLNINWDHVIETLTK